MDLSAQRYAAAWRGGGLGEMDACMCMTESFHCSSETITTLLVNRLYPNSGFPGGSVVKNPPAMKETQER